MKLGIDGWRIQGSRTGVGRYLNHIVSNWAPEVVGDLFDEIRFYSPVALADHDVRFPDNVEVRQVGPNWKMLIWENARLPFASDDDVLFCPSYSRPLWTRGRTVVATHDVTHAIFPSQFSWQVRWFYDPLYRWSAHHADLVITSTEASRRDIARVWDVPLDKIRIAELAIADIFRPVEDETLLGKVAQRFFGAAAPFFMSVGQSGRRDLPLLLRAFADFKRRTKAPHKLLMVGARLDELGLDDLFRELDLTDEVRQSGFVPDEELNLIYNAAQALIMPSVYETICLPVIEAQAVGTPVIAIDTAGSRESTGGQALFLPALDLQPLSQAMERMADDEALRAALADGGRRNTERFSWGRCARQTLEILAEAARI